MTPTRRPSRGRGANESVLLACAASSSGQALDAIAGLGMATVSDGDLHVLAWGGEASPGPLGSGVRWLELPPLTPVSLAWARAWARFLIALRQDHYQVAVVAQHSIGRARSRGLLLALPWFAGARKRLAIDLDAPGSPIRITARLAFVDLMRWTAIQAVAPALAALASRLLERVAGLDDRERDFVGTAPRPRGEAGSVIYLRTDIDLAGEPIRAGGALAHTDGILRALLTRGYEVHLWSSMALVGTPSAIARRALPNVRRGNIPTEILELVSGLLQGIDPRAHRPRDIRFIYQRYSLNNLAGLILARRWRVPLVLEMNASEMAWRRRHAYLNYERLATAGERLLLGKADMVVAVSENAARELELLHADRPRLRVIPNGVDVERFAGAAPIELPFERDAFVVCFVGLFYPWHGVRHLVPAFEMLHERCPRARLTLVGEGAEAAAVRSMLEQRGLTGVTVMPGLVPREEAAGYMAAADVLVSPHADVAGFIGSPIKVFEYMAAGRAIVASALGQLADVLHDGENALLVPPGDEPRLAEALLRLAADDDLRLRLGRAAQDDARRLHSWDARLETLLAR
jgi:glycosyltransferase involved in cell wall biosynthesis